LAKDVDVIVFKGELVADKDEPDASSGEAGDKDVELELGDTVARVAAQRDCTDERRIYVRTPGMAAGTKAGGWAHAEMYLA
jgi:hypothetical protein